MKTVNEPEKEIKNLNKEIDSLKKEIDKLKKENSEYKKLAYVDKITGCYNRTWFYENIVNENEYYISVADINFLRTINFVMGHSAGDDLLLEATNIFKKYGDVVRIGGDEFIIISYNKKDFDELNSLVTNKFSVGGCYKPKKMPIAHAMKVVDKLLFENKKYNKTGGAYED